MTTALALYAGFVSTVAMGWQIVSWRLSRRTNLKVNLSRHIFRREDEAGRLELVSDNIVVSVINLSEHPVRVTKARLANTLMIEQAGVEWLFAVPPDDPNVPVLDLDDPLARVIEARDSIEAAVPTQSLQEKGIHAWTDVQVYLLTPTNMWFSSDGDAWPEESSQAVPATETRAARRRPTGRTTRKTQPTRPRTSTRRRRRPPPAP